MGDLGNCQDQEDEEYNVFEHQSNWRFLINYNKPIQQLLKKLTPIQYEYDIQISTQNQEEYSKNHLSNRLNEVFHNLDELFEAELVVRVVICDGEQFIQSCFIIIFSFGNLFENSFEDRLDFSPTQKSAVISIIIVKQLPGHLDNFLSAAHLSQILCEFKFIYRCILKYNSQNFYLSILQISQMSIHIVTQIKRDVDEVQMRQYSANKQKKQLKHFSLYLKQIVKIQRFYRSYLVLKTKRLEKQIVEQLKKKQLQYFRQKDLCAQIQKAKKKRERLLNMNLNKMVEHQKQNICENVRQMIKNVVNCADKYAKNSAISKISMGQLQKCIKQQKELKAEIKELQLQKQCYEQRMESWENKLKEIRERTMQQMSIRNQLEAELEDCY